MSHHNITGTSTDSGLERRLKGAATPVSKIKKPVKATNTIRPAQIYPNVRWRDVPFASHSYTAPIAPARMAAIA